MKTKWLLIFILIVAFFLATTLFIYHNNEFFRNVTYSQGVINKNFTGTLTGPLQEADFELQLPKGIAILELFTESLKKKLGTPLKVEETDELTIERTYFYPDFQLITDARDRNDQEIIALIVISGGKLKTNRGLKVGDDASKVLEKYGSCQLTTILNGKTIYKYSFKSTPDHQFDNRFIDFTIDEKQVKEILFMKNH